MEFKSEVRSYKYLGDRLTAPELKGAICQAVTVNGKCIRRGASMLVSFGNNKHIVLARLLRKHVAVNTPTHTLAQDSRLPRCIGASDGQA